MGCGPGHVARYLSEQGLEMVGVDLSPAMVERARRLTPQVEFRQGDMLRSSMFPTKAGPASRPFIRSSTFPRSDLPQALGELRRVLRPGGLLLLAFHLGSDTVHLDEWWGHPVSVDFFFFQSEEMATYLRAAGFEIEEIIERDPYPDVEHPSRRGYIFARKANRKLAGDSAT